MFVLQMSFRNMIVLSLCKTHVQVLSFMRTGIQVMGKEVLSVCLNEDGLQLQHSPNRIRKAIEVLKFGKTSDTKDFLDMKCTDSTVISRKTSVRRRAANIYLHKLTKDLQHAVKQGNCLNF